jgi:Ca2+/Na+ antiporter
LNSIIFGVSDIGISTVV